MGVSEGVPRKPGSPPSRTDCSHPAHSPGLLGSGADSFERLAARTSPTDPRSSRGGRCGPQPHTPRSSRIRSVPVETRERDVPTARIIWSEGPQWARSPWEGKGASERSSARQSPRGSKGGCFPVPSASGGGPPCASREEKNTGNKRVKSCPKCEGVSGLDKPQLGIQREGAKEARGRGVTSYRGRRRSSLPLPPRRSCSSACAAGARARPRLRPPAPRGLLGAVVSARPGPCGLCPDHVEEGLVK